MSTMGQVYHPSSQPPPPYRAPPPNATKKYAHFLSAFSCRIWGRQEGVTPRPNDTRQSTGLSDVVVVGIIADQHIRMHSVKDRFQPCFEFFRFFPGQRINTQCQSADSVRANSLPPQQQTVYLHRESKGRGGKAVTLIKGLVLSDGQLSALTKKLKQTCGSGGTVKDGVIEIQGEHREKIADTLQKLGYKVKVAGG